MRYQIITIGKLKRGFLAEGCAFYAQRLENYGKVEVLELKEGRGSAKEVQEAESTALLAAAKGHLVALDETGQEFTSEGLAAHITALENRAVSQLSVLIGGANGHTAALKLQADELWRLSALTLPHELARLVGLEQLYRAETIRAGHPYHRA